MPGDELRMAFVLASQTPSSRAEESGSRPPSMKHRSDEVRGAGAWRHRHLEKVWFAHTDARMPDIMMSRSARRTRRRRSSRWDNWHNHVFAKTNGANCPAVRKVPNCSTYRLTGTPGDGSGVTCYARIAGEVRWLWPGIWPARGPSRTSARLGYCIFLGKRDRSHPAGACH